MRTVSEMRQKVTKWAAAHAVDLAYDPSTVLPKSFSLGTVTKQSYLNGDAGRLQGWTYALKSPENRRLIRTHEVSWLCRHVIPTHIEFATLADLAQFVQATTIQGIHTLARRVDALQRYTGSRERARELVSATRSWNNQDYRTLTALADYYTTHGLAGLTPREAAAQVPGVQAKWLDQQGHRKVLQALIDPDQDQPELPLVQRPKRILARYLDPDKLGNRRSYDVFVEGDVHEMRYRPTHTVIVENDDVFDRLGDLPCAIVLQGSGKAGPANLRAVAWWLRDTDIYYIGDLDAEGYAILSQYRNQGYDVTSVLMDAAALADLVALGTNDATGIRPLCQHNRSDNLALTPAEQEAYDTITSPSYGGFRRIEQEAYITRTTKALLQLFEQQEGAHD